MKKNVIIAMLICLLGVACTDNTSKKAEEPKATSSATTVQAEEFKSKLPDNAPVVKVITSVGLPPFSYQDKSGNLQGIDIDVIRAVGEAQGFKVELTKQPFAEMFNQLEKGQYQIAIYDLSLTKERAEKFGHTIPYIYNPSVIVFKNDRNITSLNDLKNLSVSTLANSKQSLIIDKIETRQHDKLATVFAQYQGLLQNKYDAIIQDKYLIEYLALSYPEHKIKMLEYEPETEMSAKVVMYTKKNDHELISKLNKGIESLQKSGEINRITKKHLKASH